MDLQYIAEVPEEREGLDRGVFLLENPLNLARNYPRRHHRDTHQRKG